MNANVPRRKFLNRLLLLGTAAAALPAFALPKSFIFARKKEVMLDQLSLSDFAPHLGGKFTLLTEPGRKVTVELIEATALGKSGPRPSHLAQRAPFSVVFLAPKGSALTQRIYRVGHEVMGEFDVFLVPIGLAEDGLKCEAIFN